MTLASLDLINDHDLEARVCIIGAGAAGITLACEFDACGFKILLLEAGGLKPAAELTDYYAGTASAPHADPTQFRRTIFGGTTGIWGGRCVAFDPIDFEPREYIAGSGWPINYEELAKHYPAALRYCDAGSFDFSIEGSLRAPAPTIAGFSGAGPDGTQVVMNDRIERYSLPTDFGRRYRQKIKDSSNVMALTGARCLKLDRTPGSDRVTSAELVDGAGADARSVPKCSSLRREESRSRDF